MSFSKIVLLSEADRLVSRSERHLHLCRKRIIDLESRSLDTTHMRELAARRERELKRLTLYRAVLMASSNPAHALMPEYVEARGLVDHRKRGPDQVTRG